MSFIVVDTRKRFYGGPYATWAKAMSVKGLLKEQCPDCEIQVVYTTNGRSYD